MTNPGQSFRIFSSKTGVEFAAPTRLAWSLPLKLNRAGQGRVYFPRGTPELEKFGESLVLDGNLVVVQDDVCGTFGGVMVADQDWDINGIAVDLMSAEYLPSFRRTPDERVTLTNMPPGAIFAQLIQWCNVSQSLRIDVGLVDLSGPHIQRTFNSTLIYDAITDLSDDTGFDWSIEPYFTNGVLRFYANWYARRGKDVTGLALKEGINVERGGSKYKVAGPIINDALAVGVQSASGAEAPRVREVNSESRAKYGLRQFSTPVNTSEGPAAQAAARHIVDTQGEGRKQLTITALNRDGIMDTVRIGDRITYFAPNYGFTGGKMGSRFTVRVTGLTVYNQASEFKKVPLEVVAV